VKNKDRGGGKKNTLNPGKEKIDNGDQHTRKKNSLSRGGISLVLIERAHGKPLDPTQQNGRIKTRRVESMREQTVGLQWGEGWIDAPSEGKKSEHDSLVKGNAYRNQLLGYSEVGGGEAVGKAGSHIPGQL